MTEIKAVCASCQRVGDYTSLERQYCHYCGHEKLNPLVMVDQKLQYLDRLTELDGGDITERIKRVCNSIEQDLGIKPADYDVIDTTTMDMPKGFIKVEHPITKQDMMLLRADKPESITLKSGITYQDIIG